MLNADHLESIGALRGVLHARGYPALLEAVRPQAPVEQPWPDFEVASRVAQRLTGSMAAMFQLFALGKPVPLASVDDLLAPGTIDGLVRAGLLTFPAAGQVQTAGYGLVPFRGYIVAADLAPHYPTALRRQRDVVVDADTFVLARLLPGARHRRFIEVCAGAGLISIVASATAEQVVAADLNPAAVGAAQFNAALNGVQDRVHCVRSDLFDEIPGCADRIVVNPPYVPMPQRGLAPYLAGDGGEDGLRMLRRCVSELPPRLAAGGVGRLIAGGFAAGEQLLCAPELAHAAAAQQLAIQAVIISDSSIEQLVRYNAAAIDDPEAYAAAIRAHAGLLGADRYQAFLLRVSHGRAPPGLQLVRPTLAPLARRQALRSLASEERKRSGSAGPLPGPS